MRIQHNIMAMNAYRNYNTNTSALSKNLEKLSSGYKINRAGDDAAGLAISEKMRAQITGLNAAQKNVKDGISLVKTAEGAMQEIQDMLNRMDYLATQSANGTYDNEVDRANLQKEVDQLKSEINRIADSANFNGIKLLDGSLSSAGIASTEGTFDLPSVGEKLGVNTVLHKGSGAADEAAYFTVQMHDVAFDDNSANTFSLKIGNEEFTLAGADGGAALTAGDIADKFLAGDFKVTSTGAAVDATAIELNGNTYKAEKVEIGNGEFGIKFTQTDVGKAANIDFDVKVSGKASNPSWTTGAYTAATAPTDGTDDGTGDAGTATAAAWNDDAAVSIKLKIDGKTYTFSKDDIAGAADATAMGTAIGQATASIDGTDTALSTYVDITEDGGAFTLKVKDAYADKATVTGFSYTQDTGTAGTGGTAGTNGTAGADGTKASFANNGSATATDGGVTGDWNVTVTDKYKGQVAGDNRLASTVITMKASLMKDGSSVTIGGTEYKFSTDKKDIGAADTVYIGDLDMSKTDDVKKAIDRLTDVADTNEVYTVGYNGNDKFEVTLTENVGYYDADDTSKFDLTKLSEIERSLGYKTAGSDGKPLTLQIGDTSDDFNQLKVKVGDMHTAALGIANLDISKPESASAAIQTIKNAINQVSSIRGDLGATQNRLEHTANNLSVMAENIQDAESTIRDTDVADEMMAYTKNNILIQSAQAMLAQANQVPQGVLQLLQ